MPSTCPCTIWPPNLSPEAIARSRLTALPSRRAPSAVRLSVSGMAKKVSLPPSASPTVRQVPFTETLSPARVSAVTRSAEMLKRNISPLAIDETRPTSSTSPVNMFLLSRDAGIERHGDVRPDLLDLRDRELQRLDHFSGPERTDHRHALGTEDLGRVEKGHLVREPLPDEASSRLASTLNEQTFDPPPAKLVEHEMEVNPCVRAGRGHDLDSTSLEDFLATVERKLGGVDHDGSHFGAPCELALGARCQVGVHDYTGYTGWPEGEITRREHGVVGPYGVGPDQHGPRLGPQPVRPRPRVLPRDPPGIAARRRDPAVQRRGQLEVDERPPRPHAVEKLFVLPLELGCALQFELDAGLLQKSDATAPHPGVRVEVADDDARDSGPQDGLDARWRPAVVIARLQRHVKCGPSCRPSGTIECGYLSVVTASPRMPALA